MIERASEFGNSQAAPLIPGDSTDKTAGDLLREAREAHGLHIEMVAAALKVPTQKLQALEDDNIESLPDPVFARALAASVCRALRIDSVPVLAKLPGARLPSLSEPGRAIDRTSFRPGAPRSSRGAGGLPSRALLVVVVFLLAGAAALFWLPSGAFEKVGGWWSHLANREQPAAQPAGQAPSAAAMLPSADTVVEPAAETVLRPDLAASEAPPAASSAPRAAAAPSSADSDLLLFVAREASWITVADAGGRQLLRRTVQPGETVGINGAPPLSVVVGRASSVDVQVRGRPFDLAPLVRSGGVARFEVKAAGVVQ
jgi:cytoskeleton protein RodZ